MGVRQVVSMKDYDILKDSKNVREMYKLLNDINLAKRKFFRVNMYSEQKGDLLIWYLWAKGAELIIDTIFLNTDDDSYVHKTPKKILQIEEREKMEVFGRLSPKMFSPPPPPPLS